MTRSRLVKQPPNPPYEYILTIIECKVAPIIESSSKPWLDLNHIYTLTILALFSKKNIFLILTYTSFVGNCCLYNQRDLKNVLSITLLVYWVRLTLILNPCICLTLHNFSGAPSSFPPYKVSMTNLLNSNI